MDYENVYYVDGRNATIPVRDHRTVVTSTIPSRVVPQPPVTSVGWTSTPSSAPYQYPAPSYYGPTSYPGNTWNPSMNWGYPVQPPYVMPPVVAPQPADPAPRPGRVFVLASAPKTSPPAA